MPLLQKGHSVDNAPFHVGKVMMVVCGCFCDLSECSDGMYLVLYPAHGPLGVSLPHLAELVYI